MISIDDHPPSDPSSSHDHHQEEQIYHDLKVSDLDLKFPDVYLDDTNNPLPNFSVRDYVFGIRNKDITRSWPFSPKSLQLCLKHGVKNLLPPFESIDSLRNNSSLTRCSLEDRLTDEKLITSFDGKPKNDQSSLNEQTIALESVSTKSSVSKGDQESQFHLQYQTKSKEKGNPQKCEKASSIRTVLKKSRFLTKVNSGVEHTAPNSETMISKVCPVCKVFLSSSNTTLNAHIDQCLTGEGTMKWTENTKVNVAVKHRVKPRKMRLMLDIYKTAPHCTIEELDKRNGTSWATNSSFPTQEFEFQDKEVEEKEEVPKRTTVNPEGANNEGDVYIDSDGTKVRILSVPKLACSSNNHGGSKLLNQVKRSKILGKKKKNVAKKKHHHKYLKLSPSARSICSSKSQETSGQEDDVAMNVADLGIIRPPWACSKRSGLSKKSSGKKQMNDLVFESEKSSSKCDLGTCQSQSDNVDCLQNDKKLRISLALNKQPDNRMVFRSQHSDYSPDTGSKGSRFPSLSKNQAPKINLKRKFPDVEKFHVKSVDGSSQYSLQEQSRMEEQVDTNEKEDKRSITSKSSNGDSSLGIQAVNQDEFHDGESVKNETLLSNVPSFMGLSTSFDPQFSKQECDELYEDQICSTNRAANDVEILENYCQEVDPIPIPGPPGSFLPASPGGEMVSEEEIQPVMILSPNKNQQHDSMSNSPVSTISNPRSTSVQDDTCKKTSFIGDMGFPEKGLSQPCCCSRKEVALNYQDSCHLRKQPIAGFMFSPATETVSFPTNKKFAVSSDCDSPASSPSKPVLRLMGKNLTLAKSDEDELRHPQSSQQPAIFSQYQNGFQYPPVNMRNPVDSIPVYGGFMGYVDRYWHGGPYLGPSMPQTRYHNDHNVLNFQTINGRNVYNAASSSKPINEIIIIDDSYEKEADDSMRSDFFKRNQEQMNPPYGGGGSTVFRGGDSTVFRGGGLQTSTSYYPLNYP